MSKLEQFQQMLDSAAQEPEPAPSGFNLWGCDFGPEMDWTAERLFRQEFPAFIFQEKLSESFALHVIKPRSYCKSEWIEEAMKVYKGLL